MNKDLSQEEMQNILHKLCLKYKQDCADEEMKNIIDKLCFKYGLCTFSGAFIGVITSKNFAEAAFNSLIGGTLGIMTAITSDIVEYAFSMPKLTDDIICTSLGAWIGAFVCSRVLDNQGVVLPGSIIGGTMGLWYSRGSDIAEYFSPENIEFNETNILEVSEL